LDNIDKSQLYKRSSKDKIKVLIISEPLLDVSQIVPFIECMMTDEEIELSIKVRPMVRDLFYEKLISVIPQISKLEVYDGKLESVAKKFDVFIGTNSTAVIEASLYGKISILLNTPKFGDYFDMDKLLSSYELLVKSPELLCKEIRFRVENEVNLKTINKTRNRFFGDNHDGSQWIIERLKLSDNFADSQDL
jgi:hypothetical protein